MANDQTIDLGGMDLKVNSLEVGVSKPGTAGNAISGTELGYLDGVTAGTATASKALVLNSSKGISTITSATITTLTTNTVLGVVQGLSGAGAVSTTNLVTLVTSTGANALTLANGIAGQLKIITMIVDGGDATLTPTTKTGFSTITFNDVGDGCVLVYADDTRGWMVVGNNGCTLA